MRLVFLGTPEFALPPLRVLLGSRYSVCAVFTQPDRPAGRGRPIVPPPVKEAALEHGIPVYQPAKIRAEENRTLLQTLAPDFLVVVAYGQLLPGWMLQCPRIAPVNIHASLLPRYRGAAPVAHAILHGDSTTGVSTMWIEETMDTGPVLLQREVSIPLEITCGELEARLAVTGAEILLPTLDGLRDGSLEPRLQQSELATYAPKLTKEMGAIDWRISSKRVHDRIRGLNPWPVAFTEFRGERLQVFRSLPYHQPAPRDDLPGTFLAATDRGSIVACGGSTALEVLEVQLPGRKRISGREFAYGARLRSGELAFTNPPGDSS